MRVNIKHLFLAAFIALTLLAHSAFAQDTSFRSVQLAYGISLDVPSHWTVLSLENRKNLGAAGQAMTDNTGIEGSSGRKESLLAMNATPNPTGAMIRVSVTSPPDYTQSDLAAATPADLQEVGTETLKMLVLRHFVWNPTVTMTPGRRARWACVQAACRPVHMSTGRV